jgi:plastocyanin
MGDERLSSALKWVGWCCLFSVTVLPTVFVDADDQIAVAKETGIVEGTVVYDADPDRPWRLGRYYIKDKSTGALAEAVVALDRKGVTQEPREPQVAVVDQKNFQFTPETVVLRKGDSVRFLNSDEAAHNVSTSHLQHAFNVTLGFGDEHVEKFPFATGIKRPYRLGCSYHGAMRNWIYVFDHPSFQLTGADGTFRMENVPPGEYRLDVQHPAGELTFSVMVKVTAGETTKVDLHLSPDDLQKRK